MPEARPRQGCCGAEVDIFHKGRFGFDESIGQAAAVDLLVHGVDFDVFVEGPGDAVVEPVDNPDSHFDRFMLRALLHGTSNAKETD
ncbi:hypothetical protein IV498_04875 [Paenarthrobacter sp. Z7-10]|uniref:hypothetical protein n=1 Tax=Paenarthrobacter sp. Z7-10 TaxID=2787635 RepID=UPI003FA7C8F2|nr:hypothetical protein [Paenarthrobacter sp. Z7-10]